MFIVLYISEIHQKISMEVAEVSTGVKTCIIAFKIYLFTREKCWNKCYYNLTKLQIQLMVEKNIPIVIHVDLEVFLVEF